MSKSGKPRDRSGKSAGTTRREFMVSIAGVMAGVFFLPLLPGMTKASKASQTVRNVLRPPVRQGRGARQVLVWLEEDKDGEIVVMQWQPETAAEVEKAKRFYEAAHRYQDVPSTSQGMKGTVEKLGRQIKKLISPPTKRSDEEERFLEAIRSDDTREEAWMAYSRWLEAKRDPLGEFIRIVWELEHVADDEAAAEALNKRWGKLIEQHAKSWLEPLAKLGLRPMIGGDFYYPALWLLKGFPTEIEIDKPRILPQRAKEFFDAAPLVTALEINLDPFDVAGLMGTPDLKQIRSLAIGSAIQSEEDLAALLNSPNLPYLRSLNLSYWGISPSGVKALAQSDLLGQLDTLNLTGCDLDDEAIKVLVGSKKIVKLTRLVLNNNGMGADGAKAIARSPHVESLTELDVGDNSMGDEGVVALAKASFLPRLSKLILEDCGIGEDGAMALGNAGLPNVVELDMSKNPLGAEGMAALLPALKTSRLKTVNLSWTELDAAGVEQLTKLIAPELEELNLNWNSVGDAGMGALAGWKKCPRLKRLELIENGIGDKGVAALARARLLECVTDLRLDENPMGDAGARALADSAYLCRLKSLFLSKKVGKVGRAAIKKRFGEDVGSFE